MKTDKYVIQTKVTQYRQIMSETKILDIQLLEFNKGQIEGLPKNPRFIKDARFEALKKSITDAPEMLNLRELIVYPIKGQSKIKYVVICGNMRLKACQEIGYKELPCKVLDESTPVAKLREYAVKDNVAFGDDDWDSLAGEWETEELLDWGVEFPNVNLEDVNADEHEEDTEIIAQRLSDKFLIPPFDVFDAKAKDWLERKRLWKGLINDKAQARETAKAYNNEATNDKTRYKGNGVMESEVSILDPVLSEIITYWFTPNEKSEVFDVFAGDTVFGYVSAKLGHNFKGIELRKEQADFNNERTKDLTATYFCDDGRNVLNHIEEKSQDLLFSCPPYFDLEVYSDLENDASNQKNYGDFLKILDTAFTNACKCLKDNRFAVIVCGDIRNKKTGGYYNFSNDVINIFQRNGLLLYNNIKLLTPFGNAQIRAGKYMKSRKTVHVYQDVLVFYNGDQKTIRDIFTEIEVKDLTENESGDLE